MVSGAPETQRQETALKRVARLVLVLLSLAVYGQTLTFEFINLDDNQYVTENPRVLGGLSLDSIAWAFAPSGYAANWHPLVWISLMLDADLYGGWAGGFHFTNVLLHTANSLLIFGLLNRLTGALGRSFVVAALFAVHPLHVESVAWVTERKDVLSALFGLLSLGAYARYTTRLQTRWLAAAWIGMLLSLMSKQMLVTLPCLLFLFDLWPLGRMPFGRWLPAPSSPARPVSWTRLIAEKLPFIALSAAFCGVAIWSQRAGGSLYAWDHIPLPPRLSNAAVSAVIYLRQTLWPTGLGVFYPYPSTGRTALEVGGSLLLLSALTALAFRRREFLVGWVWFVITLLPVIGIIQVGDQAHADRYMYLPLLGLLIAGTWGIADALSTRPRSQRIAGIMAGVLIVVGTGLGWQQTRYWRNSVALFRRTVEVTENNALAETTLGAALMNNPSQLNEAEQHLREALRIRPDNPTTHYNLALVLSDLGDLTQANDHFREALRLKPDYQRARLLLCVNLKRLGQLEELKTEFSRLREPPESWPPVLIPALNYLTAP